MERDKLGVNIDTQQGLSIEHRQLYSISFGRDQKVEQKDVEFPPPINTSKNLHVGKMLTEHLLNAGRRSPRIKMARRGFPGGSVVNLPMQETPVPALAQEDATCRGTTKPVCHSY